MHTLITVLGWIFLGYISVGVLLAFVVVIMRYRDKKRVEEHLNSLLNPEDTEHEVRRFRRELRRLDYGISLKDEEDDG